jgi:hypothetical protein
MGQKSHTWAPLSTTIEQKGFLYNIRPDMSSVGTRLELTSEFSKKIRFKSSMFDDHMPWAYNSLFAGIFFTYFFYTLLCTEEFSTINYNFVYKVWDQRQRAWISLTWM